MNGSARHISESELVTAAVNGDRTAFGKLVERYRDAVYGLAYHHLSSFEDARDVAQESFVKAYLRLSQLCDPSRFGPWLRQIATNECLTWHRRNASVVQPLEDASEGTQRGGDRDFDRLAVQLTVRKALSCLTDETRLAVTLFYINGYSHQEIAGFLEVSPGAVKTRLRDARRRLRRELMDMVEETIRSEPLSEEFSEEIVRQAIERAKEAQQGWSKDDFVDSCSTALAELDRAPAEATAQSRGEVLYLLGEAETSWLGTPEKGIAHYKEAHELAKETGDVAARAKALKGLYLAHLRHGNYAEAHMRAREAERALSVSPDWAERCLAQAAQDVCELVQARWQPGQPGGYALGFFMLDRAEEGWSCLKPEGVCNVSWGRPDFATTLAHLWRLGPLLTDNPKPGRRRSGSFEIDDAYCGWTADKDEPLGVETEVSCINDTIATPAGDFQDCVKLTFVVKPTAGEFGHRHSARTFAGVTFAWFAPGVGLVKITQVDQNDITRTVYLHEYSVSGSKGYFPVQPGARWNYRWMRDWNKVWFEDRVVCRGEDNGKVYFTSASWTVNYNEEQVRQYWAEVADSERKGADTDGYAEALNQLIRAWWRDDRLQAKAYAEELVAHQRRRNAEWGLVTAEDALAELCKESEPTAQERHQREHTRLALARASGHRRREANTLSSLAATSRESRNCQQAVAWHEEAATVFEAIGDSERCATEQGWAELARRLDEHREDTKRPAFRVGVCYVRQKDGELSSRGASSSLFDSPWPPAEGGSPMADLVSYGFYLGIWALHQPTGTRYCSGWNFGLPAGCESMKTTVTVTVDSEKVEAGKSTFRNCRLVEVAVSPSSETDTVEEQREIQRGYFAGTIRLWFAPGIGCVRIIYSHRNGRTTDIQLMHHDIVEVSKDYFPLALQNRWVYRWTDEASKVQFEDTVFVAAREGDEWNLAFVTAATVPGEGAGDVVSDPWVIASEGRRA